MPRRSSYGHAPNSPQPDRYEPGGGDPKVCGESPATFPAPKDRPVDRSR